LNFLALPTPDTTTTITTSTPTTTTKGLSLGTAKSRVLVLHSNGLHLRKEKAPTWQVAHITGGCNLLIYTGVEWACYVTLEFYKAGIFVYQIRLVFLRKLTCTGFTISEDLFNLISDFGGNFSTLLFSRLQVSYRFKEFIY
jgi:hypothetical protein